MERHPAVDRARASRIAGSSPALPTRSTRLSPKRATTPITPSNPVVTAISIHSRRVIVQTLLFDTCCSMNMGLRDTITVLAVGAVIDPLAALHLAIR